MKTMLHGTPSEHHGGGGADIKQLRRNVNAANQSAEPHSGMNVHLDQQAVGHPEYEPPRHHSGESEICI